MFNRDLKELVAERLHNDIFNALYRSLTFIFKFLTPHTHNNDAVHNMTNAVHDEIAALVNAIMQELESPTRK